MSQEPALRLSVLDQSPIAAGQTAAEALANTVRLAKHTEKLGFYRYWVAEHHGGQHFAASAPEIVLARLGAETSRIRIGAGAILLPHYAPLKVAEVFRTLEAFYPGRVDLGIGRGQGGSAATTKALRSQDAPGFPDQDFASKLSGVIELLGLLPSEAAAGQPTIRASPGIEGAPELWLLGSSLRSAALAAKRGLRYSFSQLFSPELTRVCLEHYRKNFVPGGEFGGQPFPEAGLAVGVICADTKAEAKRLFQTVQLRWHRAAVNDHSPFANPDDARAALAGLPPLQRPPTEFPRYLQGTPEEIKTQLTGMAEALQVQELLINTITHDSGARERSYTLLAEAFGLTPRTN